ncbi:MAG: hypothetical protein WAM75_11005 [Xanthobacteraceae bacterium]
MLNTLTREITLAIQARSGTSVAVIVWLAILALAAFIAFAFLCVSGYAWFAVQFGDVFAGLIMAGIFAAIALMALLMAALVRRRVRERAILARAAKAHSPSWLLDPKLLGVAVEAGRSIGWQRLIPVALLGVLAAQWARDYRKQERQKDSDGI